MQIKKLFLYKKDHDVRTLEFQLNSLNIITGESKSGKTAIIDMVNYCLGSSSCDVKGDKIIHTVEYFGILISLNENEIIVVRQNPYFLGQNSTNDIYFEFGSELEIPKFEEIIPNSNISALISFLTEKISIGENLFIPKDYTRDSLSANFKHSRIFCFQPQNVIAEFKYLFFSQDESWVEQAIKDTLPFFLGAVQDDEYKIKAEIREINRQLNRLYRKRKESISLKEEGVSQLNVLIEEAIELEILSSDILSYSREEKLRILKSLSIESISDSSVVYGDSERLDELISLKKSKKNKLDDLHYEIKATESFIKSSSQYNDEVIFQESRLESIGLYKEPTDRSEWNAIIGAESEYLPPKLDDINKSLLKLRSNIEKTKIGTPQFTDYLAELKSDYSNINDEIIGINEQIDAIYESQRERDLTKNINIRKGKLIGKIELITDSIDTSETDSNLERSIIALEAKLKLLEDTVSLDNLQEKLDSALTIINNYLTTWSHKLNFEYPKSLLRFSIKKLTVIAETEKGSLPLNRIGGAENWLACHLLIHLALHKYFFDNKRPVPHFLILDQPTQVHYPDNYQELPGKYVVPRQKKFPSLS